MKIFTIHSFAIHGTASMKAVLSLLGTRVLPVPSLYLTGLTNITGYRKTNVEFKELFEGSLALASQRKEKLIFYIGYLGSADQVEIILKGIDSYSEIIEGIVVDPVSGDHGRSYVPDEVMNAWPALLEKAHWALPNFTEVQLHSGLAPDPSRQVDDWLEAFRSRFPKLSYVITSLPDTEKMLLRLIDGSTKIQFEHEKLFPSYSGTGDVFAALFINYFFLKQNKPEEAMRKAALATLELIRNSIDQSSPDLVIEMA